MNVLFVCSANMCRSPMAEGYLQKVALERGLDDIVVQSAALYYQGGEKATEGARFTANNNEFSLDNHRSQYMDDDLFAWADVVFIMTSDHYRSLLEHFGDKAGNKVEFLGKYDPEMRDDLEKDPEIHDPYGGANVTYAHVFDQIKRSIDNWLKRQKISNK